MPRARRTYDRDVPTMRGPIRDVAHALERARYRGWCARHYEGDNPDYLAQTLSRQRAELDYAIGHLSGGVSNA